MHTVKSLRDQGFQVRVHHIRRYKYESENAAVPSNFNRNQIILARGGVTDVAITTPDGKNVRAFAYCSDKDGYNKKRGVLIALGRAMKQLNNPINKSVLVGLDEIYEVMDDYKVQVKLLLDYIDEDRPY